MKLEEKREIKTFPFTHTPRTRGGFLHPSWSKTPPVLLHSVEQFASQQHQKHFTDQWPGSRSVFISPLIPESHRSCNLELFRCQGKQDDCRGKFCFHHHHRLNGTNPQTLITRDKLTSSAETWQSLMGIWIPHLSCQIYTKRKGRDSLGDESY